MMRKILILLFFAFLLITSFHAEVTRDTIKIETFPFTENFDTITPPALPEGWTVEDTNQDSITWVTRAISGSSAPYAMSCDYNDLIAMDDWFFTPSLHLLNGVAYRVIFSYKCEFADFPEKLELKWGDSPSSESMTSAAIYSNNNITNESFQQVTSIFLVTTRGEGVRSYYNLGFHGFSDAYQWTLWVDNITIEEIPPEPIFHCDITEYDFGNQQISYNSPPKIITVTNEGAAELYITSCSLVGADATEFELLDENIYTVSLIDLDKITVGVRFHPQTIGVKSIILRFMENETIAHDIPILGHGVDNTVTTFPFNQNFETAALPVHWAKLADGAGWRFGSNLGRGTFPIPIHTNYAAVNKNTSIFEYDPMPGRNDFLIPPPFNMTLGVGIPHLTFNSYFTMLNGERAYIECSTDGTNWEQLYELQAYSSGWKFIDVNLNAFITCSRFFLRFHADDFDMEDATGWAIDDVNLLFVDPNPTPPTNVRIHRTGTTIQLTWDPVLYVSGYRVYSAPDPYSDLWTLETPVPITETSWMGNTSLPNKFFRIKSIR
jgi:hypothetical protein